MTKHELDKMKNKLWHAQAIAALVSIVDISDDATAVNAQTAVKCIESLVLDVVCELEENGNAEEVK
ncbi:hypothetical protein HYE60_08825 [Aggregatibacter actinomycetemcomitans]|uniref:hypothetical protein n=1 Tax=Aggregatibacter actinomycetemcomitans TaxID=714 RepID=UPI00197C0D25|nr:hypothetical protein [Aggregatibacter actinomycetemcomitans]MBN6075337.1 hypothetical protein [Aggregatibacter actinomycetemcomitans]